MAFNLVTQQNLNPQRATAMRVQYRNAATKRLIRATVTPKFSDRLPTVIDGVADLNLDGILDVEEINPATAGEIPRLDD